MSRKNHKLKHIYDDKLHDWYNDPTFARFRTNIIQLFLLSTPLFAASISLLCLLTIPAPHAYIPASIFAVMGGAVLYYLLWLMELFRKGVLGVDGINDTVHIGDDSEGEDDGFFSSKGGKKD
jgi:hypothetical protein